MQGFMILANIGTEKDTLVFYTMQIVDGRNNGWTNGRKVELLYRLLLYQVR